MPKRLKESRPLRQSEHISRRVTQSVFRAFDYAFEIGSPLNLYVVINLHDTMKVSAAAIFEAIRHKYRDWLNYRTKKRGLGIVAPMYIYAMENPSGTHPHVNWALHVPHDLREEFAAKLPRWIEKAQGKCGPSDCVVQSVREDTHKQLAKYIVKGTDPGFVDHFHLQKVYAPQGQVWGKRAGVSPSLGATVRKVINFRPRRSPGQWRNAA
jgi:hypothetical protein